MTVLMMTEPDLDLSDLENPDPPWSGEIPEQPRPPGLTAGALRTVPCDLREDAIQEAWVAYLQWQDPRGAVARYVRHEKRFEIRHRPISQTVLGSDAADWLGLGGDGEDSGTGDAE